MSHPGREGLAPTRPQPGTWYQICRLSVGHVSVDEARAQPSPQSCQDRRHTQAPGGNPQPEPLLRTGEEIWKA